MCRQVQTSSAELGGHTTTNTAAKLSRMNFQQMPAALAMCMQNGPDLNPKLVYPAAVIVPDDLQLLN